MRLPELKTGVLLRRYKRFLADVRADDSDEVLTVHCPNTGRMTACAEPGYRVWYWDSGNPKRKYRHTWELAQDHHGFMINVNTGRANAVVEEAVRQGRLDGLAIPDQVQREVRYGRDERSRIDLWCARGDTQWFLEVKNVTLLQCADSGQGAFPDAVSARASRHLEELAEVVAQGHRACLVFNVAHTGIRTVQPARHIDPAYAAALERARAGGVEVIALSTRITPEVYEVTGRLPVS